MASVSHTERITPVPLVHAAILGAALTVLALDGGLMSGLIGGSFAFHALIGKVPNAIAYTLAAIAFFGGTLSGSALWGMGMARLARIPAPQRAVWASILSFVPLTFLLNIVLVAIETSGWQASIPVHRLFTMLFVPSAFLIAGTSSLALGWGLGWGRGAPALALRVGLTAALAFLAVNLTMEELGWQVGGPHAEERGTMITVLIVSNLGTALAGGAMLGMTLTRPH
jgi:hypothetical protein